MRPSHDETTSKQEVHKLKVSIIGLLNPSMRYVPQWDRLIQEFVNEEKWVKKWFMGKLTDEIKR